MTATAQHMTALQHAQEIRLTRAALRLQVRSRPTMTDGYRAVAEVLTDPPPYTRSMLVRSLLKWPFRAQTHTAQRLLVCAGISEFATVEGLTYRQRAKLVELLDERYGTERTAA